MTKLARLTLRAVLPLAVALLAACERGPIGPDPLLEQLPRPLTSTEREVIGGSNDFAFELLRQVAAADPGENVFVSPLSVSMALGMTMNGAAGSTYEEMRATLGFDGLSDAEINAAYRGLLDLLLTLDRGVELGIANSVWYRQDYPFEANFFDVVRESFDAQVEAADFGDPATLGRINGWVASATRNRIDRVIEEIDPADVMYLINAIYFEGPWRQGFDRERTTDDVFRTADGGQLPVRMMHTDGTYRYAFTPEHRVLELPYGNGAYTMTIVLPGEGRSLDDLLASIDAEGWEGILEGMVEGEMMVALPRFRMEYEASLVDPLVAMGMRVPFAPGEADFTRMSGTAGRGLFISDVKHRTFLDVDEEGTVAAAVTAVTIREVSAPSMFRVDRPFLVAIRERLSGTILFAGAIERPSVDGD